MNKRSIGDVVQENSGVLVACTVLDALFEAWRLKACHIHYFFNMNV